MRPAVILWSTYFIGLCLWTAITYASAIQLMNSDTPLAFESGGQTYAADFLSHYNSGVLARRCLSEKVDIWSPEIQSQSMQKLIPGVDLRSIFYSQYPPYEKAMMILLPSMPLKTAYIVWDVFGVIGIIFGVQLLAMASKTGRFETALAQVSALASYPAWLSLRLGQTTLLLYPAMMAYWTALAKKKWFLAGLAGGFCLIKLQYAPGIFLTGCIVGGKRFAAGYLTMALAFLAASLAVFGLDNVINYPKALLRGETQGGTIAGVAPEAQQNLRGQLVSLLGNDGTIVHWLVLAAWIAATLFIAFLWYRFKKECSDKEDSEDYKNKVASKFKILAAVTVLLQLVTNPHTHRQDYLFISLPAIWLIAEGIGSFPIKASDSNKTGLLLTIRYMLIGFPLFSWISFLIASKIGNPIQLYAVWNVLLLLLVFLVLRTPAADTPQTTGSAPSDQINQG